MTRFRPLDVWRFEKALTAIAMVVCVGIIFTVFVAIGEKFGWLQASAAAAFMLAIASWAVIRFIPLSEYRGRK